MPWTTTGRWRFCGTSTVDCPLLTGAVIRRLHCKLAGPATRLIPPPSTLNQSRDAGKSSIERAAGTNPSAFLTHQSPTRNPQGTKVSDIGIVLSDSGHLPCVFNNLVGLFFKKNVPFEIFEDI